MPSRKQARDTGLPVIVLNASPKGEDTRPAEKPKPLKSGGINLSYALWHSRKYGSGPCSSGSIPSIFGPGGGYTDTSWV